MEQNQEKTAVDTGGRYYPRKMRTGWCVAHHVTAYGITIERFGPKFRSYREAFNCAERLNREEAAAKLQATAGEGKEVRP